MALLVTVTPSYQLTSTTRLTPARLNLLARPTFSVTGTTGTSDIADGSITSAKTEPGAYFYGDGTLAGGVYSVDLTPNMPTGYVTGAVVRFKASAVNAGAVDINCDSRGAKDLVKFVDTDSTPVFSELAAGDIREGQIVECVYDGTRFALLSTLGLKQIEIGLTASGTNTYATDPAPAYTAYSQLTGRPLVVTFTNANTSTASLNVNSLGVKSLLKNKSQSLASGDIQAGHTLIVSYDGTNFQILAGFSPLSQTADVDDDGGAMSASGNALRTLTCSTFTPKTWHMRLKCTTDDSGSTGYVINDEVDFYGVVFSPAAGSDADTDNWRGAPIGTVRLDTSGTPALKVAIHDVGGTSGNWRIPHKTTGALTQTSRSKWTVKARIFG